MQTQHTALTKYETGSTVLCNLWWKYLLNTPDTQAVFCELYFVFNIFYILSSKNDTQLKYTHQSLNNWTKRCFATSKIKLPLLFSTPECLKICHRTFKINHVSFSNATINDHFNKELNWFLHWGESLVVTQGIQLSMLLLHSIYMSFSQCQNKINKVLTSSCTVYWLHFVL